MAKYRICFAGIVEAQADIVVEAASLWEAKKLARTVLKPADWCIGQDIEDTWIAAVQVEHGDDDCGELT